MSNFRQPLSRTSPSKTPPSAKGPSRPAPSPPRIRTSPRNQQIKNVPKKPGTPKEQFQALQLRLQNNSRFGEIANNLDPSDHNPVREVFLDLMGNERSKETSKESKESSNIRTRCRTGGRRHHISARKTLRNEMQMRKSLKRSQDFDDQESNREAPKKDPRISASERQNNTLRMQLASAREEVKNLKAAAIDMNELTIKMNNMEESLKRTHQEETKRQDQIIELKKTIENLQTRGEEQKQILDKTKKLAQSKEQQLQQYQLHNDAALHKLGEHEGRVRELEIKLDASVKEVEALTNKSSTMTERNSALQEKEHQSKRELLVAEQNYQKIQQELFREKLSAQGQQEKAKKENKKLGKAKAKLTKEKAILEKNC